MAVFNVDGKSITQVTNGSPVIWSTNSGDLFLNAGATIPYAGTSVTAVWLQAHNQTKTGTVNAGATVHTVNIIGVFPLVPQYQFSWKLEKRGVITNVKRNGSRNGRILGDGQTIKDKNLVFRRRRNSYYAEFEAFYDWHYPHKTFKYIDLHLNETALYQIVEATESQADSFNANSWECKLAWVGSV